MKKIFKIVLTALIAVICIDACKKETTPVTPVDPVVPEIRTMVGTDWLLDIVIEVIDSVGTDRTFGKPDALDVHFMSVGLTFDTDSTLTMKAYMYNTDLNAVNFTSPEAEETAVYGYEHPDIFIYEIPGDDTDDDPETKSGDTLEETPPATEGSEVFLHLRFRENDENFLDFVNWKELLGSMFKPEIMENLTSVLAKTDFRFRKITVEE